MVKINDFFKEYSRIINKLIPVIGIMRSQKIEELIGYDNISIKNWIEDLNNLKNKYEHNSFYTRLIDARIFEQKELKEISNNPMFWVDNTLSAISAIWRYTQVEKNSKILKWNINLLVSSLPLRIKELRNIETNFSRVRGHMALAKIKRELQLINNFNSEHNILKKEEIEKIVSFSNELIQLIKYKCENNSLIIPYNKRDIERYVYLMFGIKVDFRLLKTDLENIIQIILDTDLDIEEEKDYFSSEEIMLKVHDIINCSFNIKTDLSSFIDTIKLLENKNVLNTNINTTSYIKNMGPDYNNLGYIYLNQGKIDVERLKLKLVHEIFPGHHYQNYVLKKNKNICFTNSMLDEGWAKYSEYIYVKKSINIKSSQFFLLSIKEIAISIYAMILLNVDNMNISDIVQILSIKFGTSIDLSKNIILKEYMDPLSSISYYMGLHIFLYILEEDTIDEIENIKSNMKKVYNIFLTDGYTIDYNEIREYDLHKTLKNIKIVRKI